MIIRMVFEPHKNVNVNHDEMFIILLRELPE